MLEGSLTPRKSQKARELTICHRKEDSLMKAIQWLEFLKESRKNWMDEIHPLKMENEPRVGFGFD